MGNIQIQLDQNQIEQAVALYQAGNFEGARVIYEKVLQQEPNHHDALHLLGLVYFSLKNYQQALILITKAISIDPNQAPFHANLGNVLKDLDRNS